LANNQNKYGEATQQCVFPYLKTFFNYWRRKKIWFFRPL